MKEEIKLKSGLEIHQQLDTHKLFCFCPSVLRRDNPDYEIKRELHVVPGESGEIDKAVEHEAKKAKKFTYQGYYDNTCLVELDESPPREINQEALKTAIQISLLLNCEIIQDTQIMRKTVIDGSNTSGFQRTVLIAKEGYIETEQGKVRIQSVCLEEDAARIIKRKKDSVVYRLDRLGIPLIEIATFPDIKSSEQAKQAALKIGEILRSCKVKRGIGTIRQDVNISVSSNNKQGQRVEIKGVQEPKLIQKTLEIEEKRQEKLIKENKSRKEVRKALPNGQTEFLRPLPGAARMYPETDLPLLHISRQIINQAKKHLPKLKSELRTELRKHGLNEELVKLLTRQEKMKEFHELLKVYNNPNLVAKILTLWFKDITRKINKSKQQVEEKLTLDILETILQAVEKKDIQENEIPEIMADIVKGKQVKQAIKREKIENLEEEVMKIIKQKPNLSLNAYMGLVMKKFKGKISGNQAAEIIKKLIE